MKCSKKIKSFACSLVAFSFLSIMSLSSCDSQPKGNNTESTEHTTTENVQDKDHPKGEGEHPKGEKGQEHPKKK